MMGMIAMVNPNTSEVTNFDTREFDKIDNDLFNHVDNLIQVSKNT